MSATTPIPPDHHQQLFSLVENQDEDSQVRMDVIRTMGSIHSQTPLDDHEILQIAQLINDGDGGIRTEVAFALGEISAHTPIPIPVISFLLGRLSSSQSRIQASATIALGQIGSNQPLSDEQLAPLIKLLKSPHFQVRSSTREAIEQIGIRFPLSESAMHLVRQLLYHARYEVKNEGLLLLAVLPSKQQCPQRTFQTLLDLSRNPPISLQAYAIKATAKVVQNKKQANLALKTFLFLLLNPDASVNTSAKSAIEKLAISFPISDENLKAISQFATEGTFPAISRLALGSIPLLNLLRAALPTKNRAILSTLFHQASLRAIPLVLHHSPEQPHIQIGEEKGIPLTPEEATVLEKAAKENNPLFIPQTAPSPHDRGSKTRTCAVQ